MNLTLWVLAALLAFVFLAAGAMKLTQPKAKLVSSGQQWAGSFPDGLVKTIGALEVLAAVGLILPPLVDIAPVLTPLAAAGLAITMIGAAVTHARRREYPNVAVNIVLLALALFLALERLGPYSF